MMQYVAVVKPYTPSLALKPKQLVIQVLSIALYMSFIVWYSVRTFLWLHPYFIVRYIV